MTNQDQKLLEDIKNNCKCGHLVCTFPNCDHGRRCPLCGELIGHHISCATVRNPNVTTFKSSSSTKTLIMTKIDDSIITYDISCTKPGNCTFPNCDCGTKSIVKKLNASSPYGKCNSKTVNQQYCGCDASNCRYPNC